MSPTPCVEDNPDELRVRCPPPRPTPLIAEATRAGHSATTWQIRLAWPDVGRDETRYVVERAPGAEGSGGRFLVVATLPADSETYRDRVRAGTYRYRVKSCNAAGCSGYAGPASITVP